MYFMGYEMDDLAAIIKEHEETKTLKDTPAYKTMMAEAKLQKLRAAMFEMSQEEKELLEQLESLKAQSAAAIKKTP